MTTGEQKHKCTRCGLTCDLAEAPQHFFRKPGGKHGLDHRCKACFAAYTRERYQVKRNDPAYLEKKRAKNRAAYQRRKGEYTFQQRKREQSLASYHRTKADRSKSDQPARPLQSTREPVALPPVVSLDKALRDLEAALRLHLVQTDERDETLVKYLHVTRAIWARIAPESISKGA